MVAQRFRHGPRQGMIDDHETLPETNTSPLQMDGWNAIISYWGKRPIFRGELDVSFREGNDS